MSPERVVAEGGSGPRRRGLILAVLLVVVLLAAAASVLVGSVTVPPTDVLAALLGREVDPASTAIVTRFRLPKAATAALAGAALGVAGLLMQTLFRNPLAGPYVLGVSAGASLGVALVVLGAGATGLGFAAAGRWGSGGLVAAASLGAGGVLFAVLLAARRVSPLVLLILGVLFGYAAGAAVTVLLHLSVAERVQAYVIWTFGSFGGVTARELGWLTPVVVLGLLLAGTTAKPLDAMAFGSDAARSLGVAVGAVRTRVLLATALLAGAVTAFCGPIGFLGVAVPHLARGLLATGEHRWLLPGAALVGAAVALIADLVAQLPGHGGVLPLNAVTALVGTPVLAWVVLRRRGGEPWS